MPFDPVPLTTETIADRRNRHLLAGWLFTLCFMTLVMVALGGATRLTGSGLSIMEWAPIMGSLPPMSGNEWLRLFALYQKIPQYDLLHAGFGLDGFKHIFWLEWTHRLWGRLIGFAFLLPLIALWWRGAIPRRLLPRLGLLFVLGGLQGAVGWFMVASGFLPDSTAVSPYRLVVHLTLALTLYAAMLWTGFSVLRPRRRRDAPVRLARALGVLVVAVALTIIAGGFVAGLHAGLTYNTYPLMDGQLVPEGYASMQPFLRNLTENIPAVQFDHRLLATATALLALAVTGIGWVFHRRLRPVLAPLAVAVTLQYGLGVATLLNMVPVPLAVAHQACAVLLLTTALAALHVTRRGPTVLLQGIP